MGTALKDDQNLVGMPRIRSGFLGAFPAGLGYLFGPRDGVI